MAAAAHDESNGVLPGEDLALEAEEIASWIVIYEELSSVLQSVILRCGSTPEADPLRRQRDWIEARLVEWRDRHARASGIAIDAGRTVTHGPETVQLTRRESELLEFLLRHPRRDFTAKELATLAWRSPWLSDAQVRTYMMRLRRRMRDVGLEGVATLTRSRGYGIRRRRTPGHPGARSTTT